VPIRRDGAMRIDELEQRPGVILRCRADDAAPLT
jgi:hypothetical protein